MTDARLPEEDSTAEEPPAWGFRITLFFVAVYLVYRIGQMVWWGILWVGEQLA